MLADPIQLQDVEGEPVGSSSSFGRLAPAKANESSYYTTTTHASGRAATRDDVVIRFTTQKDGRIRSSMSMQRTSWSDVDDAVGVVSFVTSLSFVLQSNFDTDDADAALAANRSLSAFLGNATDGAENLYRLANGEI